MGSLCVLYADKHLNNRLCNKQSNFTTQEFPTTCFVILNLKLQITQAVTIHRRRTTSKSLFTLQAREIKSNQVLHAKPFLEAVTVSSWYLSQSFVNSMTPHGVPKNTVIKDNPFQYKYLHSDTRPAFISFLLI